ncbi:MAG: transposase, partial [Spirochaetales bacterium]|nr:transposase [Spirochaetales bacterium]
EVPRKILEGWKGYIQTDGLAAYNKAGGQPGIIHVGCWALILQTINGLPSEWLQLRKTNSSTSTRTIWVQRSASRTKRASPYRALPTTRTERPFTWRVSRV